MQAKHVLHTVQPGQFSQPWRRAVHLEPALPRLGLAPAFQQHGQGRGIDVGERRGVDHDGACGRLRNGRHQGSQGHLGVAQVALDAGAAAAWAGAGAVFATLFGAFAVVALGLAAPSLGLLAAALLISIGCSRLSSAS